jgi:hypothetical protein
MGATSIRLNHVESHESRLIVVRIGACTVDEARVLAAQVGAAIKQAPGPVIASADFRPANIFAQEVIDVFLALLKSDNPKIDRSGHLVGTAMLALQIERMVREANNPRRRVFRTVSDAVAYLGEALTIPQLAWLRAWYDAGTPAAVPSSP